MYLLCCSLPVPLSLAETWTMPLASISKVTSIWGTPLGAGGIPTSVNWPNCLLSHAISRSPWCTLISTWVCPSAAVENTWLFFVGMVVLREISLVNTPPRVSIPARNSFCYLVICKNQLILNMYFLIKYQIDSCLLLLFREKISHYIISRILK